MCVFVYECTHLCKHTHVSEKSKGCVWGECGCRIGHVTEEPLSKSWGPDQSPGAATEITTGWGLQQGEHAPFRSGGQGLKSRGQQGPLPRKALGKKPCCLSCSCWDHLSLLWVGPPLPLSSWASFQECPCLGSSPPFYLRTAAVRFRAHLKSRGTSS